MKRVLSLAAFAGVALVFGAAPAWAAKPQVTLSSNVSTLEGGSAALTVSANAKITGTVTVQLTNGTATGGATCSGFPVDYNNTSLSFVFSNAKSVTQNAPTCGDSVNEGNETFKATITSAPGFTIGQKKQATITIQDDDLVTVSINNETVNEGSSTGTLAVTPSGPTQGDVTVNWSTADGTATSGDNDYTSQSGSVVIPSGSTAPVSLPAIATHDDSKYSNPNETFGVRITGVSGAGSISTSNGTVTITEASEPPYIHVDDATDWEGNILHFVVHKTGTPSESNASADWATGAFGGNPATGGSSCATPGVDYISASGTVSFGPGGDATQDLYITTCDDSDAEFNETFTINLTNPQGAQLGVGGLGTIKDNDPGDMALSQSFAPDPDEHVTAHVENKSGDSLPGVLVRFEKYTGFWDCCVTLDDDFDGVDLGGDGGAAYFTTDSGGDAVLTVPSAVTNTQDVIVACVVPGTSSVQAACGLAHDPDLTGVFDGNDNTTIDTDPGSGLVRRVDILWGL